MKKKFFSTFLLVISMTVVTVLAQTQILGQGQAARTELNNGDYLMGSISLKTIDGYYFSSARFDMFDNKDWESNKVIPQLNQLMNPVILEVNDSDESCIVYSLGEQGSYTTTVQVQVNAYLGTITIL
ncbi:hypothetical protein EMN47_07095 [Prolixibacteraceae bacterium JC049]|nr:hypothetical protein [Prolixibacteraceae bacterium JC049]